MKYVIEFFNELLFITSEMAPYLLLGFLFAGILHIFVRKEIIGKYVGKKTFFTYLFSIIISSVLIGILIDNSFLRGIIMRPFNTETMIHSHFIPDWLKYGSTIILFLLTLNALVNKYKNRFIKNGQNKG